MAEGTAPSAPVTGGFLMRTGRAYQEQGNIHQAIYVYFNVIDCHPDTKEAQEASDRLLKIAPGIRAERAALHGQAPLSAHRGCRGPLGAFGRRQRLLGFDRMSGRGWQR